MDSGASCHFPFSPNVLCCWINTFFLTVINRAAYLCDFYSKMEETAKNTYDLLNAALGKEALSQWTAQKNKNTLKLVKNYMKVTIFMATHPCHKLVKKNQCNQCFDVFRPMINRTRNGGKCGNICLHITLATKCW